MAHSHRQGTTPLAAVEQFAGQTLANSKQTIANFD